MFGRIPQWSHLVLYFRLKGGFFFFYLFLNYGFYFISNDWPTQVICFFLTQFWWACICLENCLFLLGCQICWHVTVHSILLWIFFFFCISVVSVVISSLSFPILFIWIFSLFFLVSLARDSSIFFTLSKNHLLVLFLLLLFQSVFSLFPLWSVLSPSFFWL